MSTSGSAATAQRIAVYQEETTTTNTIIIALTALLLYDILLTSGQEYQYIWRAPKTRVSRILYVWNRYMFLLYLILSLGTIPSISDASCATLVWITSGIDILNLMGPAMFTTLRIYALSGKNKALGGVALVLSMAPVVINASDVYLKLPANLPAPLNCVQTDMTSTSLNIGLTVASRGCLILADSLAVAVTWRQTRAAIQLRTDSMKRPSLEQVMRENGTFYFCTLVSLNVVDMAFVILSIAIQPLEPCSYAAGFIDPISSILNSRFLLALHETNARLEGVDASITSLSLNIGSSDVSRAGSPELPPFLGAIGGPIHSSHDGELEPLAFAPPSQSEEHQSEPEENRD